MMTFLIYSAKVAVLMAVFYIFYRLLLCRETWHRVNRIVLLSTALLSFVLPLCIITLHKTEIIENIPLQTESMTEILPTQTFSEPAGVPWWEISLEVLYLVGCVFVLCKILMSLFSVLRLIRSAQDVREYQGHRLIILDSETASFSWMNHIIIGRDDYERGVKEILEHESAHIALCHSWDVLLVDLISAIQWFNPAIWLLRSDLRAVHEYEADEAVLQRGADVRHYQYLLVSKALATSGFSITNQFNHSKLKNRINMMTKKRSSMQSIWKVLYILPIAALSLAASAKTVVDYEYEQTTEPNTPSSVKEDVIEITIKDQKLSWSLNGAEQGQGNPSQLMDILARYKDKPATINIKTDNFKTDETFAQGLMYLNGDSPINIREMCRKNNLLKITVYPISKPVTIPVDSVLTVSKTNSTEPVEKHPDVFAEFPGGTEALYAFLAKHIRYPQICQEKGYQNRIYVKFIVEKDGSITDVTAFVKSENKENIANPLSVRTNGSNAPLILLDGKPFEGSLSAIDPQDIDNMTVLKDSASLALYGERGKDRVILINTKDSKGIEKISENRETCKKALIDEAIRVTFEMPKWIPGKKDGKDVRTEFIYPITFRLN